MRKLKFKISNDLWVKQPSNGFGFLLFGVGKMNNEFQIIFFNFMLGIKL